MASCPRPLPGFVSSPLRCCDPFHRPPSSRRRSLFSRCPHSLSFLRGRRYRRPLRSLRAAAASSSLLPLPQWHRRCCLLRQTYPLVSCRRPLLLPSCISLQTAPRLLPAQLLVGIVALRPQLTLQIVAHLQ